MSFTADEIENKTFLVALRGYDREEVDAFLRAIAADLRASAAIEEASRARTTGANLTGPDPYANAGLAVAEVLHAAVEVADGIRRQGAEVGLGHIEEAEKIARQIRSEARANARELIANARRLLDDAQERATDIVLQATEQAEYMVASARESLSV